MTNPNPTPATIRTMTPEVIEARLKYKAPTPEQMDTMKQLNEKFVDLGRFIGTLPEGIMKSRAVTDLVLLRMVANAAVVGDGVPAGSLADNRPPCPGPDFEWDAFAYRWSQKGPARGPAITTSGGGA